MITTMTRRLRPNTLSEFNRVGRHDATASARAAARSVGCSVNQNSVPGDALGVVGRQVQPAEDVDDLLGL